jgi:hypothetical protein
MRINTSAAATNDDAAADHDGRKHDHLLTKVLKIKNVPITP